MNDVTETGRSALPVGAQHRFGIGSGASDALSPHRLISTFRRRLALFAALVLIVTVLAVLVTVRATPLYTASNQLIINTRQEQVVSTEAVLSGLTIDSSVVDTEIEVLRSRDLAERVVDALHLDQDPEFNAASAGRGPLKSVLHGLSGLIGKAAPDTARKSATAAEAQASKEQVVNAVMSGLTVRRAGVTYVMNIAFTSKSPTKAAQIANAFADQYLLGQLDAKFDATRGANTFLNTRLESLRAEVQQAEAAVEQYRSANGLMSAEGATLTEQEISAYNQQLATVRTAQAEEEARLRTARAQLSAGSNGEDVGEALGSQVVQQLRARRAEVSGRVADMSTRYGPRYPDLLRGQRELADIDSQIQAEIQRIISNLEARVQVARERTASMQGSLSGARGTLATNNAASVKLKELERNAESVRTLYQSFLDRFKETSTQEGVETPDARIVSRARIPTQPSAPNVTLNLAIGLILAFGVGLAGIVVAELLDSGLATSEDIENRLGIASLGSIPLLNSISDKSSRNRPPVNHLIEHPFSGLAESVRSLRTSVLHSQSGVPVKVLAVTSALPSEGKTTTAVCLARNAAQSGMKVVIVDCDLRRRNVNRLLGIEPAVGLLEVLNGTASTEAALVIDEATGAYILPLAKNAFTAKDIFAGNAMDNLIAQLREAFDLVILDTAPALAVTDTRTIAARADATVLLIRWRKTPEKAVMAALRLLDQAGVSVAGAALTLVDMKAQASTGYGDAGYYYSAYKKYYGEPTS